MAITFWDLNPEPELVVRKVLFIWMLLCGPCFAQELVTAITSTQLITAVDVVGVESTDQVKTLTVDTDGDGVPEIESTSNATEVSSREVPAKLIVVNTLAANARLTVEDSQRNPIVVQKLSAGKWLLTKPGTFYVRATAIDFSANIFDEQTAKITLGPPKPDVDESVDNAYGVGRIASACPIHRDAVARVFGQASDFLYGHPTLKVIEPRSSPRYKDANVSVLAWITEEMRAQPCPDEESCTAFKQWQVDVNAALQASQAKRQFTREDWFAVFQEIKKAVK